MKHSKPHQWNWYHLSMNKNALDLLKENQDKISWCLLSTNSAIFVDDMDAWRIKQEQWVKTL